jgi:hypothetical protein
MLETSYTLNLGQLLKIAFELKKYLWQKLKPEFFLNVSKTTIDKQVGYSVPKVATTVVAINSHITIIQVWIGNNTIEYVLLDEGSGINIIIE